LTTTQARCTCFVETLGLLASCFPSLYSGGGACHALFGQSCPAPVAGDGLGENPFWGAFVLWWLSREAFHISSESQSRRDRFPPSASEQRDCRLFFSELSRPHNLHFCLCCYKLQSWVVHPSAELPVLTSRSGHVSALCASKTASCPQFSCIAPLQVSVGVAALKFFPDATGL